MPTLDEFCSTSAKVSQPYFFQSWMVVRAMVMDTVLGEDAVLGPHDALLQRRGGQDHLERRARLEGIGDGPVAPDVTRRDVEKGVGVEGRADGQGQDVAGARLEHEHHSGQGPCPPPGRVELTLGDVLDVGVDRQHHAVPGHRGLEHHLGGDLTPQGIAADDGATRRSRQR